MQREGYAGSEGWTKHRSHTRVPEKNYFQHSTSSLTRAGKDSKICIGLKPRVGGARTEEAIFRLEYEGQEREWCKKKGNVIGRGEKKGRERVGFYLRRQREVEDGKKTVCHRKTRKKGPPSRQRVFGPTNRRLTWCKKQKTALKNSKGVWNPLGQSKRIVSRKT